MAGALFEPILGAEAVAATLDDRAWMSALGEVEAALARAAARAGLIDDTAADRVAAACAAFAGSDPAELGRRSVDGGNPVIPLVTSLREAVGAGVAGAVHLGATSQDVIDTASMLVTGRALQVLLGDLRAAAELAAHLAARHRDTVMTGRTLMQQALPTTFGLVAAGWGAGLDRAAGRVDVVRRELPVQLGGAAGTLAAWYPHGPAVRAALAAELGLRDPGRVWHTERGVIAELAGALGGAAVAIAKPALDVVLLAQTELGEVAEAAPGGSSSMPHKRNPIAAITARAAAAQAPGHVATLLASGAHELQRGAGPWHAEWEPLSALLRCVGGGAARLRTSLDGLGVDPAAMRAKLGDDPIDTGHAGDLVDHYLEERSR